VRGGGRLPWSRIHEYLLAVGSCKTVRQFLATAAEEVSRLIPFDTFAGIHRAGDGWCLYGVGANDRQIASYNDYYRTKQPAMLANDRERVDPAFVVANHVIDWRKYSKWEYASDFTLPNGLIKSIANFRPSQQIALSAHRSWLSPDYTETEVATLGILNQHLNIYWSLLTRIEEADGRPGPSESEIAERFSMLSPREAEVCSLIARRLSTREIAAVLFVSPRTVEGHLESVFNKLAVRSREQLRKSLEARPRGIVFFHSG